MSSAGFFFFFSALTSPLRPGRLTELSEGALDTHSTPSGPVDLNPASKMRVSEERTFLHAKSENGVLLGVAWCPFPQTANLVHVGADTESGCCLQLTGDGAGAPYTGQTMGGTGRS